MDSVYNEGGPVKEIKYNSEAYFRLLAEKPGLAKYLSVATKLIVCLRRSELQDRRVTDSRTWFPIRGAIRTFGSRLPKPEAISFAKRPGPILEFSGICEEFSFFSEAKTMEKLLLIPGPSPVHPRILDASGRADRLPRRPGNGRGHERGARKSEKNRFSRRMASRLSSPAPGRCPWKSPCSTSLEPATGSSFCPRAISATGWARSVESFGIDL